MEYRDTVLHYYPNLDVRVVDCHFSDIFSYAKVEKEEFPIIEEKDVPKAMKGEK